MIFQTGSDTRKAQIPANILIASHNVFQTGNLTRPFGGKRCDYKRRSAAQIQKADQLIDLRLLRHQMQVDRTLSDRTSAGCDSTTFFILPRSAPKNKPPLKPREMRYAGTENRSGV